MVHHVLQLRQKLLQWYDNNHRILPWRRNLHSTVLPSGNETYVSASSSLSEQQFIYYVWVSEVGALPCILVLVSKALVLCSCESLPLQPHVIMQS